MLQSCLLSSDLSLLRAQLADALACLHLAALLLFKGLHSLGLRLTVALRQEVSDGAGLLVHQVALHLCALHAFALTAKSTGAHSLGRQALLGDLSLTVHLLHGLVNHLLAIRVHEALCRSWIKTLRGTAQLANALLKSGLSLAEPWLPCGGHSRLRGLHASLLGAIEPRLRCSHAGLLRGVKCGVHTLSESRLLRGLLRHLNSLLALANGLSEPWLLRCLLRHKRCCSGIPRCAP